MKQQPKGFTLTELIVTMSIISLLMGALLAISRVGEDQAALMRSAQKLALDLSRQQTNAMSAKIVSDDEVPCGYGVHFEGESNSYILFADGASETDCSDQDFCFLASNDHQISVSNLETGIVIGGFNNSAIVFNPPEPQVNFCSRAAPAEITLKSSRTNQTIKVKVTVAGQIYIDRERRRWR